MLPTSKRLTKKDFIGIRPKVFFRGEFFDVAILPTLVESKNKCACVISKKTIKRAVDRNLVKRRVFSIMESVHLLRDGAYIIYPKTISLTTTYSHLAEEIKKAFATL